MRIAISTNDWKSISSHFYKSKGFAIFEIDGNKIKSQEYHSNSYKSFERKDVRGIQNSIKLTKTFNILLCLLSNQFGIYKLFCDMKKSKMDFTFVSSVSKTLIPFLFRSS